MSGAEKIVEQQLLGAANVIEEQVDAELEKLERLNTDDLEEIRRKRLEAMKKQADERKQWLANGHGEYEEIAEEPNFFETCKKSKRVVCHFYCDSTFRCKIVDKHLAILAKKHLETKFCKINAERCHFLVKRLKIRVMPTICLVLDGKTGDYIVGFDDLGGTDDFNTEIMEWRLARSDMIFYEGDLLNPPTSSKVAASSKPIFGFQKKKTIRGGQNEDSSDED